MSARDSTAGAHDRTHRDPAVRAAQHDGKDDKDGSTHWRAFGSLDDEIDHLARRIRGRKSSTTLHAAAVERGIREKLSSPIALAVAAGAGFAAGHWGVFRKRSVAEEVADEIAEAGHEAADEVRSARRGFDGPGFLTQIMNGLSLASSIMAMLPRDPPDDRGTEVSDNEFEPAAAGD